MKFGSPIRIFFNTKLTLLATSLATTCTMWLSRGLLASTLILAVKAQDGIEDAAMRIATGFAESLIQHAVTTLSGEAGGAGDTGDTVNAGDQGNQGNQGQGLFDASLIDAA